MTNEEIIRMVRATRSAVRGDAIFSCPFQRLTQSVTCIESCGQIFPGWKKKTFFTFGGYMDSSKRAQHPCKAMGRNYVRRVFKKKFPELYE